MKLLLLLFFVGAVAASPLYDALDEAAEELALAAEEREELGNTLREALNLELEKLKEYIEKGKVVKEDVINKLKELKEKMKDLKVDMGNKARELLQKIKDNGKDFLKKILDRLGLDKETRSITDEDLEVMHLDFNVKDLLGKLKKKILDNVDKDKLKDYINQFFDKTSDFSQKLKDLLDGHGDKHKGKLLDFIDRFLGKKEEKRSLKDYWEKVKNYFKDLGLDIQEKYFKFGEWIKDKYNKGLDKGKDKVENIRAIAKEFIDHTKGVSKDVAAEAIEFLRPYKDDLGSLWNQVKDAAKEVLNRKD